MIERGAIYQLTGDDLLTFADKIRTDAKAEKEPITENESMVTRKQASEKLNVCGMTLHRWEKKGLIKGHRWGRTVRYYESDLLKAKALAQ